MDGPGPRHMQTPQEVRSLLLLLFGGGKHLTNAKSPGPASQGHSTNMFYRVGRKLSCVVFVHSVCNGPPSCTQLSSKEWRMWVWTIIVDIVCGSGFIIDYDVDLFLVTKDGT